MIMTQRHISDYIRELSDLTVATQVTDGQGTPLSLDAGADLAVDMLLEAAASSHKIMLAGNGGSASIVSHVQNDLCKAVSVPAMVFTEQPLMTALANDDGYGSVFEKPIKLWAKDGDVLITVSSSGQSESIVRAQFAAKEIGCRIITFSGFKHDNPSRSTGDLNFYVGSSMYGYVENAHSAMTHYLTDRASDILKLASETKTRA